MKKRIREKGKDRMKKRIREKKAKVDKKKDEKRDRRLKDWKIRKKIGMWVLVIF